MQRTIRLVLVAILIALTLTPAMPPLVAFSQIRDGATLTVLRGQVAVVHTDGTAVQPAPSGTVVKAGDEIRTLTRTGALITFFSGTEIEMGEDTILVVDRVSVDGSKVDISLKQVFGTTLNRVQSLTDPSSVYRIDAGGATAVVRGTTFLLIGPVPTSKGNISAMVCLDDCDARTTFAGCQTMPYTAFGVQVGGGRPQSGCEVAPVDRGADYFNAGFEAITTFEQAFASMSGDSSPGVSNPGRDEGQRNADQRRDDEDREDKGNTILSSCLPHGGSVTEGNSGTTTLSVPVFLLPASSSNVSVNFATSGLTATPGVDFVNTSGTLTFPAGSTVQNISITVNSDTFIESNEQILVTLSNPSGAALGSSFALGTIVDDDAPIAFSVTPTLVLEGNTGITNMVFTVRLSRPSGSPTSVDYQTIAGGSATPGVDFTPVPTTTLNIPANTTTATFTVPILADTIQEPSETVRVQITNPVGGIIGTGIADGTIVDDDGPPSVSITSETVGEGCDGSVNMTFDVILSHPAPNPVSVNFNSVNGTAQAGSDYHAVSGTLNFSTGQTQQTIVVQIIGDQIVEPDETFQVNLTSASGATIAVPSGTGTILNDD